MFDESIFTDVSPAVPEAAIAPQVPETSRTDSLAQARDKKVSRLAGRVGYGPDDRTNTYQVIDGYNESMGNKILNDYSPYELEYLGSRLNNEYGVIETSEGLMRQSPDGTMVPYEGDPNDLMSYYEYGTKDGNIKRGTWGGRDPAGRYAPEYLSTRINKQGEPEFVGEAGVDVNQLKRHYLLPANIARTYEALYHGSSQTMPNRVARQQEEGDFQENLAKYKALTSRIGSGATEVYRNVDTTVPENFNGDELFTSINERFQLSPQASQAAVDDVAQRAAEIRNRSSQGVINRTANVTASIPATLLRSVVLDSASGISSALFDKELGTSESRKKFADDLFGYDTSHSQEAIKRISDRVEKIYDTEEMDMDDAVSIVKDGLSSPETLVESLAFVAGSALGLAKFTKTGKLINGIEKRYRAGELSPEEAKAAVAKVKSTASTAQNATRIAAGKVGYGATVAGMTGNDMEKFKEANNGEIDALDVIRMTAVNTAILGMDRIAAAVNLNNIPVIKELGLFTSQGTKAAKEIVQEMPVSKYLQAAKSVGSLAAGIGKVVGGAGLEGATEYVQTMAEVFNRQYATEKYGEDIGKLFLDRENQIEAWTGAAVGTVMGAEMSLANTSVKSFQTSLKGSTPKSTNSGKPTAQPTETLSPEAIAEQDKDYQTYSDTLFKMQNQLANNKLSSDTLGDHLADLEELRRTRNAAVSKTDPQKLTQADIFLTGIENRLADLVMANPDGGLVLNRVVNRPAPTVKTDTVEPVEIPAGAPVVEQPQSTTLGSRPLSEREQKALAESAIDLVASRKGSTITPEEITKLTNFGRVNGVDPVKVERIIRSQASVESEATVEDRGILGRERRLDLMLNSGTPSQNAIRKNYEEAAQFLGTTLTSISQLEAGIREAEERAATANNSLKKPTKGFTVKTEYSKADGKPFDISVTYDGTSFKADTRTALTRIEDKKRTASGLNGLLNKFHQEAAAFLDPATSLTSGGYQVPKGTNDHVEAKKESSYVKKAVEILSNLPESKGSLNRVILGSKPEGRWDSKGIRNRSNSLRINVTDKGEDYTSSDVAYVHLGKNAKELFYTSSPSGKEIAAGIKAGITFVLDSQYRVDNSDEGVLFAKHMKDNGYIPVGAQNGSNPIEGSIFVPDTEANSLRLAQSRERAAEAKKEKDAYESRQARLLAAALEESATKSSSYKGRDVSAVNSSVKEAITESRQDFLKLAKEQVQKTLPEGTIPTDDEVEVQLNKNIRTFMQNSTIKAVRDLRLDMERKNLSLADFDEVDPSLRILVSDDIVTQQKVESDAKVLTTAWKGASALRLKGQELIGALNKALSTVGKHVASEPKDADTIVLKAVGNEILSNSAGANNSIKTYAIEKQVITKIKGANNVSTVVEHSTFSKDSHVVGKVTENTSTGITTTVLNVNEVSHNPTEYLTVSDVTPLNTIPVSSLPQVFGRVAEQVETAIKKIVPPLSKSEVGASNTSRENDDQIAVLRMIDSPSRTLIFDQEGNVNTNMAAAIGIAIGDVIKTDGFKLTLGKKDTTTIANMFGVSENEVTPEMRELAAKHGGLAKSLANTLGTSTLKALGIRKLKENNVNRGQYERMVTDIGNLAMLVAETQGILKLTSEKSNVLADVYKDGQQGNPDAETYFVHIPAVKGVDKDTGVFTTVLNKGARNLSSDYELILNDMPDPTNNKKEPRFGSPIPVKEQEDILSSIRNDVVGGNIPGEAKETLRNFMNTPYEMDMESVGKFLKELENPIAKSSVYSSLGYIELSQSNPKYQQLTYDQKEVQEAINRGVETSINNIREYYEAISNGLPNKMYFPFYYTSNHRYMMNSNTLNGQADKLHRFFLYPSQHVTEYTVNRVNHTFTYDYVQNGESKSINSSLYVRAALAQAMGIAIDKTATSDIVTTGNILLSLSEADAIAAREALITTGSFSVITDNGVEVYEPDHLSHGLQGLEFIRKYKASNGLTFTDALSAEIDALTSGFSNKTQQYGSLATREEHFRRVGIVEPGTNTAEMFQQDGVGVNDMLSNSALRDSYQNLAQDTIVDLDRQVQTLSDKEAKLFDVLTPLLPGADQRTLQPADISIGKPLRNLFKPGFMIFNYSAGIKRITGNLSEAIVAQMFTDIAKADLTTLEPERKAAFEALAQRVYVGEGKPTGITVEALQQRLRNEPSKNIQTVGLRWNVKSGESVEKLQPLEDYLIKAVITPTYGASIEESFTKNFSEFIEIQNVTNDAFKLSFAVFGNLLQQKVTALRAETNNAPITEENMLSLIESLRTAFPVIAGPLSNELKEGIHVYTTDTRTSNGTLSTTVAPQLRYNEDGKVKSRRLNPLLKSIISAANAGAVLPFHALDGAQMSRMTNEFVNEYLSSIEGSNTGSGILPIHDAIMPPLPFLDITAFIYNKNTVDLNQEYSVMGQIKVMTDRVASILNGTHPTLKVDGAKIPPVKSLSIMSAKAVKENKEDITDAESILKSLEKDNAPAADIAAARIKLKEYEDTLGFNESFRKVSNAVTIQNTKVTQERETMFPVGTAVGVLVSTPGGVYYKGTDTVDLSYLDKLNVQYREVTATVPNVVAPADKESTSNTVVDSDTEVATSAVLTAANSVLYVQVKGLRTNSEYVSAAKNKRIFDDLKVNSDSVAAVLVEDKVSSAELTDKELQALETSWSHTVDAGHVALRNGATLVFSSRAVTKDLGDAATVGESYVFYRLTQGEDYVVTTEETSGETIYKVRKPEEKDEEGFVTLLDDTESGNIETVNKTNRKSANKKATSKFKEHAKKCSE